MNRTVTQDLPIMTQAPYSHRAILLSNYICRYIAVTLSRDLLYVLLLVTQSNDCGSTTLQNNASIQLVHSMRLGLN